MRLDGPGRERGEVRPVLDETTFPGNDPRRRTTHRPLLPQSHPGQIWELVHFQF